MRWERVELPTKHGPEPALGGGYGDGDGESCAPGKRWGHTCNAIHGGKFLYVFGGYGKDDCQTNQVHVFDTVMQKWSQPMIKGVPPTPRDSHSCTTVGDNLYVFGGTDGINPLNDLYILDTSLHTWKSPSLRGEGPSAREGHSAAAVGKRLFVFGGCGKSPDTNDEVYYNDLYILNTETFVWKCAATSGTPPSQRDSHTCSSWNNKIIVIGGEDGTDCYLSDVHILDTDTLVWKQLTTSGQILPPRAGHSTVAFGKILFVFGGFTDSQNLYNDLHTLDVDTGIWTRVTTTGNGPSSRFSMSGDSLDPTMAGVLAFIGGCNKSLEALDDMYYLHTGLPRNIERRPEKLSLKKQLKLKCQDENLNPLNNKALVLTGTNSDMYQPMSMSCFGLSGMQKMSVNESQHFQGKKTFQAKVIESLPNGYTIETSIGGKPLRGIIFSNKPSSLQLANHSSNRKRAVETTGGALLNGDQNSRLKCSKTSQLDALDDIQIDGAHVKESTSNEPNIEAGVATIPKSPLPFSPSEPCKVSASSESLTPLMLNNEERDGNSFIEATPTTTKDLVNLHPSQDDRSKPTEQQSDATKST